jgi:ubiquinone/menaquinone biosynthesis C-methylase UbiE
MKAVHHAAISRAMRFDMSRVLKRYADDYQTNLSEAETLERELKRYLVLRSLHPRKRYGMAGRVDGLWHTFLLFTRLYARFCGRVARRFLHHTPADIESRQELRQFQKDYANVWHDYPVVFGEPPPAAIWPTIEMISSANGEQPDHDPAVKEFVDKFEADSREIFARRKDIVAACRLQPGMAVADVGAGTGLFTCLFAAEVGPRGKVYAVDIARPLIRHIQNVCQARGISNVLGILCSQTSVKLPPHSVDLVFLCATYLHFPFPSKTMQSIHRALRRGGQVILIDFKRFRGISSHRLQNHIRAGQEEFTREIVESGFRLVDEKKFLKESYFLRFARVAAPGKTSTAALHKEGLHHAGAHVR